MASTVSAITMSTDDQTLARVTAAAREAAPAMARTSAAERAAWLRAVADALDAAVDELVPLADAETSLGEVRLRGEVARTTGQLRLFSDVVTDGGYLEATIDHADPDATPPKPDLRRMLFPLGPVAVFTASNFPFAFSVAGGDTASALAAGCPVIVKAHSGHPRLSQRTSEIVLDALLAAGAPDGAFAHVGGREAGRALVCDPAIKAAGFTGSLTGGRALFDLANARPDPIPFYGELSSINPVIVTPGAARARAGELARGLIGSFTLGVGQFCTKPGVVLVPEGGHIEQALADELGDQAPQQMLNDRIAEAFSSALAGLLQTDRVEVIAGDPSSAVTGSAAAPVVVATTVADLSAATDVLLEECFGPATLLVRYADDELENAIELLPGSLTFTVHAEEDELAGLAPLVERTRELAGRVIFGGWPTGVAVNWAQQHGGPWPSTTSSLHTSVGATAIRRFLRPIAFQDTPEALLPGELRETPTVAILRRIDGELQLP